MKRILEIPQVYNFYQRLVGVYPYMKVFSQKYIFPVGKDKKIFKILDMGCGTGIIIPYLPKNIEYLGIDCSFKYIEYVQKRNPNKKFLCQSVCKKITNNDVYDLVLSKNMMSALSNEQLVKMIEVIIPHCDENTKIIFSDMDYKSNACVVQRFFQSHERNRYIRSKDDYLNFLPLYFNVENVHEISGMYRIPYSKVVFECSLKN